MCPWAAFLAGLVAGAYGEKRWIMHMRDRLVGRWQRTARTLNGRKDDQDS